MAFGVAPFMGFFDYADGHCRQQSVDTLAVDCPSLLVKLCGGDPVIPISWPFSCHNLNGLFQVKLSSLDPGMVVMAAAWEAEHLTGALHMVD